MKALHFTEEYGIIKNSTFKIYTEKSLQEISMQVANDSNAAKKQSQLRRLWQLFSSFFRIGLFTFGGGLAMIPLIQRETVESRGWVTDDDILEIIAIAESTPGPIAVNAATFIGHRVAGILGSVCATLGVVLPSFLIIYALSFVLREFQNVQAVQYAFWGIRAGVLALIVKSLVTMAKKCPKQVISYVIILIAFVLVAFLNVNAIYVVIGSAVLGILWSLIVSKKQTKEDKELK